MSATPKRIAYQLFDGTFPLYTDDGLLSVGRADTKEWADTIKSAVNSHTTALELARAVQKLGTKAANSFEAGINLQDYDKVDRLARKFLELAGENG